MAEAACALERGRRRRRRTATNDVMPSPCLVGPPWGPCRPHTHAAYPSGHIPSRHERADPGCCRGSPELGRVAPAPWRPPPPAALRGQCADDRTNPTPAARQRAAPLACVCARPFGTSPARPTCVNAALAMSAAGWERSTHVSHTSTRSPPCSKRHCGAWWGWGWGGGWAWGVGNGARGRAKGINAPKKCVPGARTAMGTAAGLPACLPTTAADTPHHSDHFAAAPLSPPPGGGGWRSGRRPQPACARPPPPVPAPSPAAPLAATRCAPPPRPPSPPGTGRAPTRTARPPRRPAAAPANNGNVCAGMHTTHACRCVDGSGGWGSA